ncbi:hypothetical protein [Lederbergia citri]|uniref:Uncharacterized protein n=1 Tax=Lederbergia citri TaxID=2833580 RepID=A0A942TEP4_9BACI|nr:hypothetical protein [Lederbergia citri]MBS4195448.1 hypothetical protein [Lederbergia citri]
MTWYTIGTLSFPATWISILAGFLVTGLFLSIRKMKETSNWFGNVAFIFILTWKLSVIFFQFEMVLSNPLSILYFNGGLKGYWLGVIASIVYTYFYVKKNNVRIEEFVQAWILFIVIYEFISLIVLHESLIWVFIQLILGFIVMILSFSRAKQTVWQLQIMVLYIGALAIIYSFQHELISLPMATYVIIALILSILAKIRRLDHD